uniref:Uncharacterized protein n=1 Tax=Noctiluca scintillans TaxID=2966 RepID=A0A7S1A2S6_NOCSC|mmetsp:Transcript_29512/g.78053  ORF Transcript_29512/g.78053 Transcript_29512/m.78053 type:complete len:126 (+) Transcript_29512:131-508(+)
MESRSKTQESKKPRGQPSSDCSSLGTSPREKTNESSASAPADNKKELHSGVFFSTWAQSSVRKKAFRDGDIPSTPEEREQRLAEVRQRLLGRLHVTEKKASPAVSDTKDAPSLPGSGPNSRALTS